MLMSMIWLKVSEGTFINKASDHKPKMGESDYVFKLSIDNFHHYFSEEGKFMAIYATIEHHLGPSFG
jgi:hypothetical protein